MHWTPPPAHTRHTTIEPLTWAGLTVCAAVSMLPTPKNTLSVPTIARVDAGGAAGAAVACAGEGCSASAPALAAGAGARTSACLNGAGAIKFVAAGLSVSGCSGSLVAAPSACSGDAAGDGAPREVITAIRRRRSKRAASHSIVEQWFERITGERADISRSGGRLLGWPAAPWLQPRGPGMLPLVRVAVPACVASQLWLPPIDTVLYLPFTGLPHAHPQTTQMTARPTPHSPRRRQHLRQHRTTAAVPPPATPAAAVAATLPAPQQHHRQ